MESKFVTVPEMNSHLLDKLFNICLDALHESDEGRALAALNNAAYDMVAAQADYDLSRKIENLVFEAAWFYGQEMFAMGLAIGRNPETIFALPQTQADS